MDGGQLSGTGSLNRAPDVPGVCVGWRSWRVLEQPDGYRLASATLGEVWPARAEMIAQCRYWAEYHPTPSVGCGCGLYAVRDLTAANNYVDGGRVMGCVALWGEMVEGERGWRAARGYPLVLFCPPSVRADVRRCLADAYGVPAYGLPVELTELTALEDRRIRELAVALRQKASMVQLAPPTRPAAGTRSTEETDGLNELVDELRVEARRVAPEVAVLRMKQRAQRAAEERRTEARRRAVEVLAKASFVIVGATLFGLGLYLVREAARLIGDPISYWQSLLWSAGTVVLLLIVGVVGSYLLDTYVKPLIVVAYLCLILTLIQTILFAWPGYLTLAGALGCCVAARRVLCRRRGSRKSRPRWSASSDGPSRGHQF